MTHLPARIPLESWIERHYPVKPPGIRTVRRWAREGKLYPPPIRHGRAYYIPADAEYRSDADLVRRLSVPKAS